MEDRGCNCALYNWYSNVTLKGTYSTISEQFLVVPRCSVKDIMHLFVIDVQLL